MSIANITNTTYNFVDLDLTFAKNPITQDMNTRNNVQAIFDSVKNLVMTMPYETPFHPEISCQAYGILFDLITPVTQVILQSTIAKVLTTYEPRIELLGVIATGNPNANSYAVKITFRIVGQTTAQTINLTLKQLR